MTQIIVRSAADIFAALSTAQGMADAGCRVFSIVSHGEWLYVFAEFQGAESYCDVVDKAISKRLG